MGLHRVALTMVPNVILIVCGSFAADLGVQRAIESFNINRNSVSEKREIVTAQYDCSTPLF
jgi:hypothetical protein